MDQVWGTSCLSKCVLWKLRGVLTKVAICAQATTRSLFVMGQSYTSNCKCCHANHSSRRQLNLTKSGSDLVSIHFPHNSGLGAHFLHISDVKLTRDFWDIQRNSFSHLAISFFFCDPVYFLTSLAFGSHNYTNARKELMLERQGCIRFLNEIV